MRTILQRLLIASQWGASLVVAAGCGSTIDSSAGGAGGTGSTSSTSVTTNPTENLDPTPESACYGPVYTDDFGYHGQCCDDVVCTAPTNGVCLSPADARPSLQGQLPPGSGSCECEDLRGPYANNDAASTEVCCYLVGSIGCDGRPLLVDGKPRLARVTAAPSVWSRARVDLAAAIAELDVTSMPEAARRQLAHRWTERARFEHASVASFSRFALSLMAVGAPPALLEAAHQAALDEIEHARMCLSLASAYAGEPLAFGPLSVAGAFGDIESLEAVTMGTVLEGCVGETLAALEAAETASEAGPRAVKLALQAIAEDETRHAELGWAFVRWALGTGDATLRERVAAAFDRALREVATSPRERGEDVPPGHGFLPAAEVARLRRQAVADVLAPAAAALLRGSSSSEEAVVSV